MNKLDFNDPEGFLANYRKLGYRKVRSHELLQKGDIYIDKTYMDRIHKHLVKSGGGYAGWTGDWIYFRKKSNE